MSQRIQDQNLDTYDEDFFDKEDDQNLNSKQQNKDQNQYIDQSIIQEQKSSNEASSQLRENSTSNKLPNYYEPLLSNNNHQQQSQNGTAQQEFAYNQMPVSSQNNNFFVQQQYPLPKPNVGNRPQTQQIKGRFIYNNKQMPNSQSQIPINNSSPFRSDNSNHFQKRQFSNKGRPTTTNTNPNFNSAQNMTHIEDFRGYNSANQNLVINPMNQTHQIQANPLQNKYSDKPSPQQYYSQDKDRGRRQFIAQIINQQNNSLQHDVTGGNSLIMNQQASTFLGNIGTKRKKIKEIIFGSIMKSSNQGFQQIEREELQHDRRNLKISNNIIKDENIRLKTKVQQMQSEISKKEKELESITIKLQQALAHQGPQISRDQNIYESFLVSQLKRQNREMKQDILEKDSLIDRLRKDQKLTKANEMEVELNFYIEECTRLRTLCEQTMFDSQFHNQQQINMEMQENQQLVDHSKIEEAFYEKEVQLQKEREATMNLQMQVIAVKDQIQRMQERMRMADEKLKKFNEMQNENKRKQKVLESKIAEISGMREEMESLRKKASERDQVYNKNKELITKQYSQQSAIDQKEKKIQELQQKTQELEEQIKQLQKQPVRQPRFEQSTEKKRQSSLTNANQSIGYNINMITLIFRAMQNQQLINSSNDTVQLKNYYNNNKQDIDKEIETVKKLNKKEELFSDLKQHIQLLERNKSYNFNQLEKFIEDQLNIKNKDNKKYLICQWAMKHSENLSQLNLIKLVSALKDYKPQNENEISKQIDEQEPAIATVRVNESIGETTAQFIPPSQFSQTPINPDEQSTVKKTEQRKKEEQEDAEYEEDYFEKVTDQDTSKVQETSQNQDSQQITEDQMLDIAEHVFQIIADRLRELRMPVRRAFGKDCQILDEFEGEQNVEIVLARDFLECLRTTGVNDLSELEVACLMRVLSKPEIDHAIVLAELEMVMENFGLQSEDYDLKPSQEEIAQKKQKQNKKKMIKDIIRQDNSQIYKELRIILQDCDYNLNIIHELVKEKAYDQLVKTKRKEVRVDLIKKDDLLNLFKTKCKIDLSNEVIQEITPLLQIDSKYNDVFQVKFVTQMFEQVLTRYEKEEADERALNDFYKPDNQEDQQEGHLNMGGEVMNFENLMGDESENDYYVGEDSDDKKDQLNPISEDAQEESVSPNPKEQAK